MRQIPKGGLIGKAVTAAKEISRLEIPMHAANACYFLVLSIFPSLVLILSLLRYTPLSLEDLMTLLGEVVPDALMPAFRRLVNNTYEKTSGMVLSVSALTMLWSASRGMYGLLRGLNAMYGVSEDRGYFYTRSISVLYTFGFAVVLLLTLVLHVFGNTILSWLPTVGGPVLSLLSKIIDLRFFLLLFLQTALFTAMFMALPNRRNSLGDSLPGALLVSIGWLTFSDIFSIYVANFDRYALVFGSVYAVALGMLWLYCCMAIVFFGGALNRYLINRK